MSRTKTQSGRDSEFAANLTLRFSSEKFPGVLLVSEGTSCSGKSTFIEELIRILPSSVFVEWNSHSLIRPVVDRLKEGRVLSPTSHMLAGLFDHRLRLDKEVLPALRAGRVVLSDRYLFTSVVRDGIRGMPKTIFEALAPLYPCPDSVYYFEVSRQERICRFNRRKSSYGYYACGQDIFTGLNQLEAFDAYTLRQTEIYQLLAKTHTFVGSKHIEHARALLSRRQLVSDGT